MRKKFLKIDASDVERVSFLINNSMYLYSSSDLLSEMFTKYEIPKKYQLVYFYKNLLNDCIKEFFTDVPFNLQKTIIGNINARLKKRDNNEKLNFHFYLINSNKVNCLENDIMNFYLSLYENGYIDKYLVVLSEFFMLNLDLDYIKELSDGNYSVSKKKELYKQKVLERKPQK